MDVTGEYFGSPAQQALQRRAEHVWQLLRDDPRFSCHGRAVALASGGEGSIGLQVALARIQGVGGCQEVPGRDLETQRAGLLEAGLVVDEYVVWTGGDTALAAAAAVLAERPMPGDLTVLSVDQATPARDLAGLDALTQSCEVLLPMGSFIRGRERPAVCLYAQDASGRVVGAAAAVAQFHPAHPRAGRAYWGMLATDSARRGQGIALIMGALSLRAMSERYGFRDFFTGIRDGNAPSERLCGKLGFAPAESSVVVGIDPEALPGGRLTK